MFWMFMGFTKHFYIIFGTNLLTGAQPKLLFFACFSVSQKRNIKWSPIDPKLQEIIFGPEEAHGVPEVGQKSPEATTRVGVCPTP